jgi:hypothetical protein
MHERFSPEVTARGAFPAGIRVTRTVQEYMGPEKGT